MRQREGERETESCQQDDQKTWPKINHSSIGHGKKQRHVSVAALPCYLSLSLLPSFLLLSSLSLRQLTWCLLQFVQLTKGKTIDSRIINSFSIFIFGQVRKQWMAEVARESERGREREREGESRTSQLSRQSLWSFIFRAAAKWPAQIFRA